MMPDAPRRGRKPSPEKRAAILGAAQRLFAARGVGATTTREVAARAQTTERTLFKHFGSKDGLVQAVIQELVIENVREAAYARVWDRRPMTRDEFTGWHRMFLANRVEASTAAPDGYRVLFRELFRDDRFRELFAAKWVPGVFEPMAYHLGSMQERGEIASDQTPRALASAFFSLNLGYLVSRFALMPDMAWDDRRSVEAIVALFRATCERPAPAP